MILKIVATGRASKIYPKETKITIAGVKCVVRESDVWEGPTEPGEVGQYYRATFLNVEDRARDDRMEMRRG